MLATQYAALLLFQACSPQVNLYEVRDYNTLKESNH